MHSASTILAQRAKTHVFSMHLIPQIHQEDLLGSRRIWWEATMESHLGNIYEGTNLAREANIQRSPFYSKVHYEYAPQSLYMLI